MALFPERYELPEDGSAGCAPTDLARLSLSDSPVRLSTSQPATVAFVFPGPASRPEMPDTRLVRTKQLEKHIKEWDDDFHLCCEHIVTTLMVRTSELGPKGGLWAGPPDPLPASILKKLFHSVSPLCRHYMLHLDPNNLTLPQWKHAIPVPLEWQPEVEDLSDDDDWEAYQKSVAYHRRFKTNPDLRPFLHDADEEAKCERRDEGECVVTGKPTNRRLWFIPLTWNDTVEHMNATGDLHVGSTILTGVNLAEGPNPACSAHTLGATHRVWNMVSIGEILYRYFNDGFCALKYQEGRNEELNKDEVKVTLKFYWMPKLKARFGLVMDIHSQPTNDWTMMLKESDAFQNCPPPDHYGKVFTQSGDLLESGHIVNITVAKKDLLFFRDAIEVHWACIMFTAFCGAAGRPWLLSGKDPEDRLMQSLQDKARLEGDAKLEGDTKLEGGTKLEGDARLEDDATIAESSKGNTLRRYGRKVKDGIKNVPGSLKEVTRKNLGRQPIPPYTSPQGVSSATVTPGPSTAPGSSAAPGSS
ncbi:uncharacterized protein FIESC28_02890 [Fusarium coffeatum]|uniref:HNH nuclease domain-containing protein n=1 Tax=Fusarium coffeatum TaxID=231269 RepID=A0A366S6T9_9HYPO|nr:uncharacterized protein FIESC28_02890 [Fusarium coffeatum]RBR24400.1 hypothetical protein FIESC28_02890 [Fusarium coffeatum]